MTATMATRTATAATAMRRMCHHKNPPTVGSCWVEEVENWPEGRYTVLFWRMMKVPDSYCQ